MTARAVRCEARWARLRGSFRRSHDGILLWLGVVLLLISYGLALWSEGSLGWGSGYEQACYGIQELAFGRVREGKEKEGKVPKVLCIFPAALRLGVITAPSGRW